MPFSSSTSPPEYDRVAVPDRVPLRLNSRVCVPLPDIDSTATGPPDGETESPLGPPLPAGDRMRSAAASNQA